MRDKKDSVQTLQKGICTPDQLKSSFDQMIRQYGHAFVETDMRAMYNPTRMAAIGKATDRMLEKAVVRCEKCDTPGFGVTDVRTGLLCVQCGHPTQSVKAYVHSCLKCGFSTEEPNPEKPFEDPMYCDHCNP